ncbi:hypothetical protein L249_7966, partial [Ophiocordyceps polyrhachis-furcata BCC 54312]
KVEVYNKLEYNNVAIRYTFPFVQRADRCDDRCLIGTICSK